LLNFQLANFPSEENLACRHLGVDQHCLCRLVERRAGGEEMRAARLKELEEMEEMAAELLATARKLPASQERHEIFQEIRNIRARIDALKAKGK
jgi:hypothetical protein